MFPLCLQDPQNKFQILLKCPLTVWLWEQLEHLLKNIDPTPITEYEMAFVILGQTPAIIVRNLLTVMHPPTRKHSIS